MIIGLGLLLTLIVLVIGYEVFIAPRKWMRENADGLMNPRIRFNKKHLGIKKGD